MKKFLLIFSVFLLYTNFIFAQSFNYDTFLRKYTNKEDVIILFKTIKFSDKEITLLKSLDENTLAKIVKITELVYEAKNPTNSQSSNEKSILEKCAKEKATSLLQTDPSCKKLDQNKLNKLVELSRLDLIKKRESQAEQEALSDSHKNTPEFNNLIRQAQTNPPPPYSPSVLNQTGLVGTSDFYDGKFICDLNKNGVFAGNERPRNQGGRVANELFYAIANAAKASGAQVVSVGCFNDRNIAGTNTKSRHANGEACDILPKGDNAKKAAFIVLFLANTENFNTVGSYASRGFDHSHFGSDCGGTWCPYQKGAGLEPWKELAFRTVFNACGQSFNPSARPSKSFVQQCAKKAAEIFCKQAGN